MSGENDIIPELESYRNKLHSFKSSWYHLRMGYKVQKNTWRYLKYLKKHLVQTDLLAYKIESLVKELEILTNEYLAEFSDGRFSINFVVETTNSM